MSFENTKMTIPMLKRLTILAALLALLGCEATEPPKFPQYEVDTAIRREAFKTCLTSLPAGPVATKYNDWDEVVEACDEAARKQALYCVENCPGNRPAANP